MHINKAQLDPNATNLYSAVAAERAAANRRAAEVRKKLMSSTAEIEDELDTGKVSAIPKDAAESERQSGDQQDSRETEDAPDTDDPMSIWS
jgi:hypothetical protein